RRRSGAGHGAATRIARTRQARRYHHRRDERGSPDAAVRSRVASRVRNTWRRRPDDDRQRQGADERSSAADAESLVGGRRRESLFGEGQGGGATMRMANG